MVIWYEMRAAGLCVFVPGCDRIACGVSARGKRRNGRGVAGVGVVGILPRAMLATGVRGGE